MVENHFPDRKDEKNADFMSGMNNFHQLAQKVK